MTAVRLRFLYISSIALCSACGAMAQVLPPPADNRSVFAPTLTFTYDSNVARSSESLAQLRGISREDEIYAPSLQVDLARNFGAEAVYLTGSVGYDFYQTNSILNRENVDLRAGAKKRVGPCEIGLDGTYVREQSSLQDLAVVVTKNTEMDETALLGAECNKERHISESFSFSPTWSDNSAKILETTDNRTYIGKGSLAYRSESVGEISVFGQYEYTSFPNRPVVSGSSTVDDGYDAYGGGVRFDRSFGPRFEIVASLADMSLDPRASSDPAFEGLTYEAKAIFNPNSRITAELSTSRAITPSDRLDSTYSIDQTYRATVSYKLGNKLEIAIDGSMGTQHFLGGQIVRGVDLTHQSINAITGRVEHAITHHLAITLSATQEHGGADLPSYRYDDSRVGLSLSARL